MCGICGIYNYGINECPDIGTVGRMNDELGHRGPDGTDIYSDQRTILGHRYLSIIDVGNGKQPMANEDETLWLTYNGEIYNYKDLKDKLSQKGHKFKTNCDSEVILHAYEEYGIDCLQLFDGMFAFAVWDKINETLFVARDRIGIKPLYYSTDALSFTFASEIKSILKNNRVSRKLTIAAIPEYLLCLSLLNGKTMFDNIYSLQPGHFLLCSHNGIRISQYWNIEELCGEEKNVKDYVEKVEYLLEKSVKSCLMSDVSYGSLLSGGLDSSLVSAMAQKSVPGVLQTFTMDYNENAEITASNSDIKYAKRIAEHIGSNHRAYSYSQEDYSNVFENVTWHVEKPIDLTSASLYMLYKNVKQNATVVLTGEGADELFGGYYFFKSEVNDVGVPWIPYYDEMESLFNPFIIKNTNYAEEIKNYKEKFFSQLHTTDYQNKILVLYLQNYLVEMLEHQDKTSMAFGIEARFPYLNHHLVEEVVKIPFFIKSSSDNEKIFLKEVAKKWLPNFVITRKKKPIPILVDPQTILKQRKQANELVQSFDSRISNYFDKKKVKDFFGKTGAYTHVSNLAIYRTAFAMIALEAWHKAYEV